MADAVVGDIFQIAAVGQMSGQRVILTQNYRLGSINPGVDVNTVRDSLVLGVSDAALGGDVLESTYLALLPPQYTLNYWRCQMIYPNRRPYVNLDREVPGTHANDGLTVNNGVGITLRSDQIGRHGHCTKHVGPVPEDADVMVAGQFTPAYKAIALTFLGSLLSHVIDAVIGADWAPIIYNKGELIAYEIAINGFVGSTVRTQRRRTVGLGE